MTLNFQSTHLTTRLAITRWMEADGKDPTDDAERERYRQRLAIARRAGKIPGVVKPGREWLFPVGAMEAFLTEISEHPPKPGHPVTTGAGLKAKERRQKTPAQVRAETKAKEAAAKAKAKAKKAEADAKAKAKAKAQKAKKAKTQKGTKA